MIKKFIFIKEQTSLIVEIESSKDNVGAFFFGVLQNLTIDNASSQPICVSQNIKNKVCTFLKDNYSNNKSVYKLINFIERMNESDYLYYYPYDSNADDFFDILKKLLVYFNQQCNQKIIEEKMKKFIEDYNAIKDKLNAYPYKMKSIIPDKSVKIGESDKKKRNCIYCNGKMSDGITTYKERAHAIPEAVGNIKFFQNEECDICNDYFSQNAEEDLSNMLMFNRLQYGIKGKNGYPIFQLSSRKYAKYFDWKSENYKENWKYFESAKGIVESKKIVGPVVVDIGGTMEDSDKMMISNIKKYIPMHAYKTMVKCVIGLIGNDRLADYTKTIHWLRYDESYHKLPEVALIKSAKVYEEPELYIFERKNDDVYSLPYCYGEIRLIDQIFVFIIPFCNKDKRKFRKLQDSHDFLDLLNKVYGDYLLLDYSDTQPQDIEQIFYKTEVVAKEYFLN